MNQPFRNACEGRLNLVLNSQARKASRRLIITLLIYTICALGASLELQAQCTSVTAVCPAAVNLTFYYNNVGTVTIPANSIGDGSSTVSPGGCGSVTETSPGIIIENCGNPLPITLTASAPGASDDFINCTLTFLDTVKPVITCPNIPPAYLDASGSFVISANTYSNYSTDNCTSNSNINEGHSGLNIGCANAGNTIFLILNATDNAGNTKSKPCGFQVIDDINPVANCPASIADIQLDGTGSATIPQVGDGSSTDNCSATESNPSTVLTCANLGTNQVLLTATDPSGNSNSIQCSFDVVDLTNPNAICKDIDAFLDISGNATIQFSDIDDGSSDNCGIDNSSLSRTTFSCADVNQTFTVTLTVNDASGNTSSCFSQVTVKDNLGLKANCPASIPDLILDINGMATLAQNSIGDGSSTDNCKIPIETNPEINLNCSQIGQNFVTLTAEDGNGNSDDVQCSFNLVDNTAPSAECKDIDVYLDENGEATIAADSVDDGSTDNCGIQSFDTDITNFSCSDIPSVSVTLTVADISSNSATCNSTVSVFDTIAPEAICPVLPTLELNDTGYAFLDENAAAGGLSTDNCGTPTETSPADTFVCADIGVHTVILTATDSSGNSSTDTCDFRVEDNQRPMITCPRDTVVFAEFGKCEARIDSLLAEATDNCSVKISNNSPFADADSNDASGSYPVGVTIVEFKAEDPSGNSEKCRTRIQVIDDQAPFVYCIQNVGAPIDPVTGFVIVPPNAVISKATDNCFVDSIHMSRDSFVCADLGLVSITITVFDSTGNFNSCNTMIDVQDKIKPVAVCRDTFVYLDLNGEVTISGALIDSGSTDICGIDTAIAHPYKFNCDDATIGKGPAQSVLLTVFDPAGNLDSCRASVAIFDTISPEAKCKNITLYQPDTGVVALTPDMIDNGSNDECGIDFKKIHVDTLQCKGDYPIILTVFDPSGNSASCKGIVTVEDTVKPQAICRKDTVYLGNGGVSPNPAGFDSLSFDQCLTALIIEPDTFTCADTGWNKILFIAEDGAGLRDSCMTEVLVLDTTDPIAACHANLEVQLDSAGGVSFSVEDIDSASSDNCSIVNYNLSIDSFNCNSDSFLTIRAIDKFIDIQLVVTDPSGNTDTCSTFVTIKDPVDLKITCPQNINTVTDSGVCFTNVTFAPTAFDNCLDTIIQIRGDTSGAEFRCGTDTIEFVAISICGEADSCSFVITVVDNQPPTIECPDDTILYITNADSCSAQFIYIIDTDDNCNANLPFLILEGQASGTYYPLDTTYHQLITIDKENQSATCEFNVIVRDTIAPVITCKDDTVYLDTIGSPIIISTMDLTYDNSDNCDVFVKIECDTTLSSDCTYTCDNVGSNTITLVACDSSGNSTDCELTLTVLDTIAPDVSCNDTTVYIDKLGAKTVKYEDLVKGQDNCDQTVSPVSKLYLCDPMGFMDTVSLTITDPSGNATECEVIVTVADTTAPNILCRSSTCAYLDENGGAKIHPSDVIQNNLLDNCGADTSLTKSFFNCSDLGKDTIIVTATDPSGNSSSCQAIIEIKDTVPPNAICKDTVSVILNAKKNVKLPASLFDDGSYDVCTGVTLGLNQFLFDCDDIGFNTVTLTVTDAYGNSSTCESILEVKELTKPTAKCKSLVTAPLDEFGYIQITKELIDDGSYDNCDSLKFSFDITKLHCSSNTVTMTVMDMSGNMSMCSAKVVPSDTTAPTVLCKSIKLKLQPSGIETISVSDIDSGSWDGCGIDTLFLSQDIFSCNDLGLQTETLTAVDVNGNKSICEFTIDVSDPVGKCTPACPSTANIESSNITVNSAALSWNSVPGASAYIVHGWKIGGDTAGFVTSDTFFETNGLSHSSLYRWDVVTICPGNVLSQPSAPDTFATDSCNAPTNLTELYIDVNEVILGWDHAEHAIKYRIEGRPVGGSKSAIVVPAIQDTLFVDGLMDETAYMWAIKSICDETPLSISRYSEVGTFVTNTASTQKLYGAVDSEVFVDVFPNPNHGEFTILVNELESYTVKVYDLMQREIVSMDIEDAKSLLKVDISNQPAGMYIIEIVSGDFKMIKKVIKE